MVASGFTDRLPELVERERELSEVDAAVAAAAGGEGALVVVSGMAGAGKSALLAASVERGRERGLDLRRARGSELEQELSFGVIRQLFEPLLRAASPQERRRLLSGAADVVERLFESAPAEQSAGEPGGFGILHGLYWLTASAAAKRPTLLAVDDLQWVDMPSLRALSYLAVRISELPVLLVVALRPHEPTAAADLTEALAADPGARRLELSPLGPAGVVQVVRAAIGGADDELCRAFAQASGGNPFYLRQLLRAVAAPGQEAPTATDVRGAAVTTVGDRALARLRVLGAGAPGLAAAMSVLGTGRLQHAAALAEQDIATAAANALGMRRVEILADDDPFEWIHPLLRRSIYDRLSVVERDEFHTRAAEILADAGAPPDRVAVHLKARRPTASAPVVDGLVTAAEAALARDAPDVAVDLLRRALDEHAAEPPRATLLLRLGQVELTRRNPAAVEILEQAHRQTSDPAERAQAAMALAEILTHEGRTEESADLIVAAIAEFDGSDPDLALELEVARAVVFAFDPVLADRLWRERNRLVALTERDAWSAKALSALLAITSAMRGEHLDQVLPMCERALAGGTLIAERGAGAWASSHVLGAFDMVEAHDRVEEFAEALTQAARSQGSIANTLIAEAHRGWSAARRGDLARAEEMLRPLIETTLASGMFLYYVTALWWLTDAILERPSLEDQAKAIESLELSGPVTETVVGAWPLLVRGRVAAMRGAREMAEQDLRAAGRILGPLKFGPIHDPWRATLALVLGPDKREEAHALVAEELALADATRFPRPRGFALRAAGLLTGGDAGIEMMRDSVTLLSESSARYEHARSLVELGAALRRSGRRADARPALEEGMELAHLCGAERLLARAREELLAAGARPRRIIRSGFESLTASERRIVRLAAEGCSNPEIAQMLFLSVKTVESHLSNAYSKIDLSGAGARRRLRAVIAQSEGWNGVVSDARAGGA